MSKIVNVRKSLSKAATDAMNWFNSNSIIKGRGDYFAKGKLGDKGTGAVYAYFDSDGTALYVGQASRPIKSRIHDQTSPHKNTEWWKSWKVVRFLNLQNQTDRLTLELLLILQLKPKFNLKPSAREFFAMFSNETLN